jgi:hypothetical protein
MRTNRALTIRPADTVCLGHGSTPRGLKPESLSYRNLFDDFKDYRNHPDIRTFNGIICDIGCDHCEKRKKRKSKRLFLFSK